MKKDRPSIREKAAEFKERVNESVTDAYGRTREYIDGNKEDWRDSISTAAGTTAEYSMAAGREVRDRAKGAYTWFAWSDADEELLRHEIEAQGALYRETSRGRDYQDTLIVSGESLWRILETGPAPEHIEAAFAAAYPTLATRTTFAEHVSTLEEGQLGGFLSGVKGKLFEQQYVELLNDELLPDGYTAVLAESSTQPGWDIEIHGPDEAIVQLMQAKATDSVAYVREALENYPGIDVVTTEEVYSHLVMSGVGGSVVNSEISDQGLTMMLEEGVSAADAGFDFMPPVITLAFIAYTSYQDDSLSLYEKAQQAGERSGAVFVAMLIGSIVAETTDSGWLGVFSTLASKWFGDKASVRARHIDALKQTKATNKRILDRMVPHLAIHASE